MKLTKKIKEELALDLVRAATKKHAKTVIKTADKLQSQWREAYVKLIKYIMPEVPEARWAELLQARVLTSVKELGEFSLVRYEREEGHSVGIGSVSVRTVFPTDLHARNHDVVGAVLRNFTSLKFFDVNVYSGDVLIKATVSQLYDIPSCNFGRRLDTRYNPKVLREGDEAFKPKPEGEYWYELAGGLIKPTEDLTRLYMKVFVDAIAYHDQVTTALAAVSTKAQLLELFPEAEKFLPEPPARPTKIVPAQLFSDVRRMLEEGIPT